MTYNRQMRNHFDLQKEIERVQSVPCEELPDVFFPDDFPDRTMRAKAVQIAKKLCDECPIKMQCLETALATKEGYGIWGGLTPQERGYVGR